MTILEATELIESGAVAVKRYAKAKQINEVSTEESIVAFEYAGKMYLVFSIPDVAYGKRYGKRYELQRKVWVNQYIREFTSKSNANAYFKKAAVGFTKILS